jgi:hypothetical protein
MKQIIYIVFILLTINVNSQSLDWGYKIGGTYEDNCYDIAIDSADNVYLTGGICNTVNFDLHGGSMNRTAEGTDNSNIFVTVYNANMELKTAFVLNSNSWNYATDIEVDRERNIYISGFYSGTVDFNPAADSFKLTSSEPHFFAAKYDSIGNFKWANNISKKKDNVGPIRSTLRSDINSNIYISTPDTLCKVDPNGNILWSLHTNGFAVYDEKSNFYILSNSLTPWESETYSSLDLIKIDTSGNVIFDKEIISNSSNYVNGFINFDKSGNLLINGDYWGTTILGNSKQISLSNERMECCPIGPGQGCADCPSTNEYFAKFDTTGNVIWAFDFGENGPNPYIIETSIDGTIYSLGFVNFSADFDHTEHIANLTNSGYGNYVAKYDSSCNFIAATEFLGGSYNDFIGNFILMNDFKAYMCGKFMNFIDIDLTSSEFELSSYINNNWSGEDIFIAKYSDFDIQNFTTNSIKNFIDFPKLRVYPNPSTNYINIENSVAINRISIQNISGQIQLIIDEYNGNPIDITQLKSGLYIMRFELYEKIITQKLIKE